MQVLSIAQIRSGLEEMVGNGRLEHSDGPKPGYRRNAAGNKWHGRQEAIDIEKANELLSFAWTRDIGKDERGWRAICRFLRRDDILVNIRMALMQFFYMEVYGCRELPLECYLVELQAIRTGKLVTGKKDRVLLYQSIRSFLACGVVHGNVDILCWGIIDRAWKREETIRTGIFGAVCWLARNDQIVPSDPQPDPHLVH